MKKLSWICFPIASTALALVAPNAFATAFVVDTIVDEPFSGTETTIAPDGTGLSLREAIGLANQNGGAPLSGDLDGDTIMILPGIIALPPIIPVGSSITITDDVVIDGTIPGPFNFTIDAAGSDRIFIIDTAAAPGVPTVVLTEITLDQGAVSGPGGGIQVLPGASLELRAGTIISNCRAGDGGGVHNSGRVAIDGAQFNSNHAGAISGSGGGIFNAAGASLAVANSAFNDNVANRAGGAIEDQAGAGTMTTIETTNFVSNNAGVAPAATAAPGNGGAIHITGASDMTITGGTAESNTAAREGGAFWNGSGVMTVTNAFVTGNTASGAAADDGGGGIFNNGGTLMIERTRLIGNVADGISGSGGGIFSTDGAVTITGATVISSNTANRAGGGIEVIDGALTLTDTRLGGLAAADGNIAGPALAANPGNGGGIHISGKCETVIDGGSVSFNVAAREGGGLWNQKESKMTVHNGTTISNNTASGPAADDGGGGIFNNGGTVVVDGTVSEVVITENVANGAAGSGGGIFTLDGVLTITKSAVTHNVAHRAGGGIEARDLTFLTAIELSRVNLSENNAGGAPATAAPGNGGGLHITGGVGGVFIGGCSVTGNVASSEGGGLWNGSGSMTIEETLISENTASGAAADNGGGGIFNAGGIVTLNSSVDLTNNVADGTSGSGGGIFNDIGGTLAADNSTLTGNRANRAGGGIEDNSGVAGGVTLTGVKFTSNNAGIAPAVAAPGNGGAVHVTGSGDVTLTDCTASTNTAAREGGAYWNDVGVMTVERGLIDANTGAGPAADDGGGGIFNNGGELIVRFGTTISNNRATGAAGSGGGILNLGALSVEGARFEANIANRAGGAVEDASGSATTVTLENTDFIANNAGVAPAAATPGNGGAVHVGGDGNLNFGGGAVRSNVAAAEGGAIWVGTGTLNMSSVEMEANVASGAAADEGGGGIFVAGGKLVAVGITLTGNIADGVAGSGGGILNDAGGSVTLILSTLRGNVANRAGGGIEDNSGAGVGITLQDVAFIANIAGPAGTAAPGNGGALHVTGAGDIDITGGSAEGNLAASEGGAYWNGSGTMTVEGGIINANIASGAAADNGGGGVFNSGGSVDIKSVSMRDNAADGASGSGGGIFNGTGGKLAVSRSRLDGNSANRAGGGIEDNAGASVELADCVFHRNSTGAAPGNGGGFHVTGAGMISVTTCSFDGNISVNEGGGLWNSGAATMTIRDTTVNSGTSADGGGVFQQAGSGILAITNSTISGNEASNGAGLQVEGGTTDLLNVSLIGNVASGVGGGANVVAGDLNLANSAIGYNVAPTGPDLNGVIASASHSLLEDVSGAIGITDGVSGNIVGVDPQLGLLANNGGPTFTHLPAMSSPLVNAGSNAAAAALTSDQRGFGFARISGGTVDIGAVEVFILTYAIWAEDTFTDSTPLDQRDPDSNPDCDARTNAEEFLTGSNPENGTDGSAFEARIDGTDLVVSYDRVNAIPAGIDDVENSTDLDTWTLLPSPTRVVTSLTPTLDRIDVSVPIGVAERIFGRLSLNVP